MFWHNFKYTFKTLFRNKMLIFWTFAFPLILGTFFKLAFSNIEKSETFEAIDIAVVKNESFSKDAMFKEALNTLGNEKSKEQLFSIKYTDLNETKKLLEEDKIVGYILIEDTAKVIIKKNGTSETILKYVVEEILQTKKLVNTLSEEQIKQELMLGNIINYEKIYNDTLNMINDNEIQIKDISSNNLSYTMIEFYTLIALTCLYGGILGMTAINNCLPNMSKKGKRVSISPTKKTSMIFSSISASYLVQLIGLFLLFIFTIFILKVDYGNNLFLIILLCLIGSLAGLSLGTAVATFFKTNDDLKMGILIAFTMVGCFLSGMMGITMKYIIDTNVPILNKINPANMITDGFYSLYYYDTLDRYFLNILSLLIFSLVMIVISYSSLRRQKYDSI